MAETANTASGQSRRTITRGSDLDGVEWERLSDEELLLAVLLTNYDMLFCDEHQPCIADDAARHRERLWAATDEAQRRWGRLGAVRLETYGAQRRRVIADELVDLARSRPEIYLAVVRGEPPPTTPAGEANRLLADYRRQGHGAADAARALVDHITVTGHLPAAWRAHDGLTDDERAVIAGLLAPSDEVNHDGITVDDAVWDALRRRYPPELFHQWARSGEGRYDAEAGS